MFFKKSNPSLPAQSSPDAPSATDDGERALDTIAALVRAYARYAIDTDATSAEQIQKACDGWASRIIIGATRADNENSEPPSLGRRDWGGLLRFFEDSRHVEADYVVRSLTSLRESLQQFASCLGYALATDRQADGSLEEQLQTLAASLDDNDPERIRKTAERVLKAARLTMLERRQREAKQVEVLADKFNQLKTELLEARTQATTDTLTQLYNRNALDQHLERIADWGILFQHSPALILVDVDHFKEINDTFGHPVGDEVLRRLADVLTRSFLRRQDFVARYGGEEFAVVAVETPPHTLQAMAERLLNAVRKMEVTHAGQQIEVTISLGVAQLAQGERPAAWIERADQALYEAKHRGRDRMITAA